MKNRNTNMDTGDLGAPKKSKGTSGRYASKKAYFARNANGALSSRNKARRAAKHKRRADYWATSEGQSRKFEKMNTPEKLAKKETAKTARDLRRRQRKLEAQKAEQSQPQA